MRHSTEVALALLNQQPRVPILLNIAMFMDNIERSNPSSANAKYFTYAVSDERMSFVLQKKIDIDKKLDFLLISRNRFLTISVHFSSKSKRSLH